MTQMHDNGKDDDLWLLLLRLSVEVGDADTTTNRQRECCRQVGSGLQNEQRVKRGRTMPMRRTSKEEEDDDNDEEDDAPPPPLLPLPSQAATKGCHASSATAAFAQAEWPQHGVAAFGGARLQQQAECHR
jgi:hypothetical protein